MGGNMINIPNPMLIALIADIQTDINYLKKVTTKLQEAVEELRDINDKEETDD